MSPFKDLFQKLFSFSIYNSRPDLQGYNRYMQAGFSQASSWLTERGKALKANSVPGAPNVGKV